MVKFIDVVKAFINGITKSKISFVGAILTTVIFPVLLISVILDIQGFLRKRSK